MATSKCRYCGLAGHSAMLCYARPKNRALPRKTMKRIGKQGQKWIRFRTEWFKNNPQDRYQCYICGDMLLPNETQLDHIASRARHPELRFIESNLAPVCHRCNRLKGSRDLEEVLGEIN